MVMVSFKQIIPGPQPRRASRTAEETLPVRAMQFCEPVCTASANGWYLMPPMSFAVQFDGVNTLWTWEGQEDNWYPLRSAQFPGFSELFDKYASGACKGLAPPFLTMGEDHAILQIWTGVLARTPPGWSLLVRAPANLPRSFGYEQLEAIIDTDAWFGPLITNIRLIKTDVPIYFDWNRPMLQVQPVRRSDYAEMDAEIHGGIAALTPQDWDDLHKVIRRPIHQALGGYAGEARKRHKHE